VAELPNLLVVRSFSKAHAMAGLRAGAALGPAELVARLAPSGGIGAPAQAAALWGVSDRGLEIAGRRRAAAAAAHERLNAALAGSPFSALPATVPFAWISSDADDGPAIAARLASQQLFVAPSRLWRDERRVRAALRGPAAVDRLAGARRGAGSFGDGTTGSPASAPVRRRRISCRPTMKARVSMGASVERRPHRLK
jgi:histidinol-phosphate/aromatic aminotransferase/cobyric acid decarboxylase-like protein